MHSREEYSLLEDDINFKNRVLLVLLVTFCWLHSKEQMSTGKDGHTTYGMTRKTTNIARKSETGEEEKVWNR